MKSGRRRILGLGAGLVTLFSLGARAAHADTWDIATSLCAFSISGAPQVMAYASGTAGHGIYSISGNTSGTSWSGFQTIRPDGFLRETQLSCASDNSRQALVVYRDGSSVLRSRDRASGWQETTLPGGFSSFGQGLVVTLAEIDSSTESKFAAFAVQSDNTINMWVWDDATNPKWSQPVTLTAVPGGITAATSANYLTAYSILVGGPPAQAQVSLFLVANSGHLVESKGMLSGTRVWNDYGVPSGTTGFLNSNALYAPTATGLFDSPFGHPPPYSETEYNRRVYVPLANQTGIYSLVALAGQSSFLWMPISAPPGQPTAFFLASTPVRGCFNPGEPCAQTAGMTATYLNAGVNFSDYYAGTTDGSQSQAGWTNLSTTAGSEVPTVIGYASGTNKGFMFVQTSATNLSAVNLDTGVATSLGHP